jgi:putative tryptophan/tyrosine transport system substrate-binding protein
VIHRREFIGTVVGGLLAAPLGARAQQVGKAYRIGWLDYSSSAENLGIFVQAMSARGWVNGSTFRIEYRGGEGKIEHLATAAAELVRLPVDVIIAPGTFETLAAKKATASVPIIMAGVDDPVGRGFVASLARPGGNITGLASARNELSGKLLSLLLEFVPRVATASVLWDTTDPDHRVIVDHLQVAAERLGISLRSVQVQAYTEVEPAFEAIKNQGNQVLIVPLSTMLVPRWIADLALKYKLPLASTWAGYAYEGGLIAYTDDWNAVFNRAAILVDRILKGAKPADLPVELPTKFKLIVNAKTAQKLGLTVPVSIMVQADYIIE